MITFVRGVIAASSLAGSMLNVSSSMSAKTGVAPVNRMLLTDAMKVKGLVITSSPGPTSWASSAR